MSRVRFTVGSDVGGTFTDVWVVTTDGRTTVVKTPTTDDLLEGITTGLRLAAQELDVTLGEFLDRVDRFGHGTTVGLNALLTGPAERTAVVTTRGFSDTLEIGRLKRQFAGLNDAEVRDYHRRGKWPPLVPREHVYQVPERIDRSGSVAQPLDEDAASEVADSLAEADVEAVAICTLWAVENPDHERRIAELVAAALPEAYLSVSHEVAPVIGEYGRMATTVANAMLGPVMSTYFGALESRLSDEGLSEPILPMSQAGGVVPTSTLERVPVSAVFSGPAAGVIGCQTVGDQIGAEDLLTVDVGGTSFDAGLVVDGSPVMRSETTVGGADIQLPSIDVESIGAGGGSIAAVEDGALTVGPASAGSDPGPACYGRGGTKPTSTDADLALGVINPDYFIGGEMVLDEAAAERAIATHVADPLDVSVRAAAWGIRRVLDSNMADLLRRVTIERGYDPREFTMVACGGSGPSHAWELARALDIDRFVVPPTATAHSAFGTGTSDLRRTAETSVHVRLPAEGAASRAKLRTLGDAFRSLEADVVEELGAIADPEEVSLDRVLSCRYRGQHNSLDVDFPEERVTPDAMTSYLSSFEAKYESLYGRGASVRDADYEIHSVRVVGSVDLDTPGVGDAGDTLSLHEHRSVVFDDPEKPARTAVYRTERPSSGARIDGPAVLEYPGHTAVVPPSSNARTDEFGNLHVEVS